MGTARSTLRRNLLQARGGYLAFKTTSAGNAGGTTIEATTLQNHDQTPMANQWLFLPAGPDGSSDPESRRIDNVSGSTATVAHAFSAQVASGVDAEILPYNPDDIHNALNIGARELYPHVAAYVSDESIIVDGLLTNPSLDTFADGDFTGWTQVGSPTLSLTSEGAGSITASGADEGIKQDFIDSVGVRESDTVHVKGWIKADAADVARFRLTFDGSTFENSDYHTGDGKWEMIEFSADIPDNPDEMTLHCIVADGNTAEFDLIAVWIDPIVKYSLPTDFIGAPQWIYQQKTSGRPSGEYEPLGGYEYAPDGPVKPKSGYILRLLTRKELSEVSDEDDEIELEEPRIRLVVLSATAALHRMLGGKTEGATRTFHQEEQAIAENALSRMLFQPGMRTPRMGAQNHPNWSVLHDESGTWILLPRERG